MRTIVGMFQMTHSGGGDSGTGTGTGTGSGSGSGSGGSGSGGSGSDAPFLWELSLLGSSERLGAPPELAVRMRLAPLGKAHADRVAAEEPTFDGAHFVLCYVDAVVVEAPRAWIDGVCREHARSFDAWIGD
jgi:hypothetical protein